MGFRATNLQNENVLSISRSMMDGRKGKIAKKTIKCECSKCGQIAVIVESNRGTEHAACMGMKLSPAAMRVGLRGKVKGTWETWIDPIVRRQNAWDAFILENSNALEIIGAFLANAIGKQYLAKLEEIKAANEQASINSLRAMTPGAEEYHLEPLPIEGVCEDT